MLMIIFDYRYIKYKILDKFNNKDYLYNFEKD